MLWIKKPSKGREWGVVGDVAQMQVARIGLTEKEILEQRFERDKGEL